MRTSRAVRALALAVAVGGLGGCVVTTHEGPSEPPRGAIEPIWPPLGESPTGAGDEPGAGPARSGPEAITASHILVMHRGSLRAPPSITRTKEEARVRAEEALARAKAGEDFGKLVSEYSDEPGAAGRAGSLGKFPRGVMVREFENAAFELQPGALSDLVESPFGYHIILRSE